MLETRCLDHLRLLNQFSNEKGNQYNSISTIETPNTPASQEDNENIIKMPLRFYRQVTYDVQLQAYVFIDINATVPAVIGEYVIFHEHTNMFRYNLIINQFKWTKAKDCDWTTRSLL